MRRVALLCMGLVMGAASAAEAQLTMQMSNGWSFTFGGNVNAFLVYEKESEATVPSAPLGGIVGPGGEGVTRIRTGLLPAFAVFDAKGKEGNTDLARSKKRVRASYPVRSDGSRECVDSGSDSEGTRNVVSPANPNGSRLVTRIFNRGDPRSNFSAT